MPVTKIQPIDSQAYFESSIRNDSAKPVSKSRFKRFFDRPFPSVLRNSSTSEKLNAAGGGGGGELPYGKEGFSSAAVDFEPSSVCLAKMVQNFIEESNEKQPSKAVKCGRNRCNCFNGNGDDSSDDEFDFSTFSFTDSLSNSSSFGDSSDTLKSLILCASVSERNLLADTSKIIEKNKSCKRKDDFRKIVADGLIALGYTASICKSKWEKSSTIPAGEYEYIDVIVEGERVLIDVDFRSEFEIARSTGSYKAILQLLPFIFVGKADRLQQIVSIASEAARLSLKKKGMHMAPWRKAEYMKAKWLSPYTRASPPPAAAAAPSIEPQVVPEAVEAEAESECGELDLIFGEKTLSLAEDVTLLSVSPPAKQPEVMQWQPPAIKPKGADKRNKVVVTGLAALLK